MSRPLTLQQSAALVGGHCWVERRLFEVLGALSVSAPGDAATLALDRHAQHASWRADQWWDRLPVLARVDRQALVVAGPGWSALSDPALAGPELAGPALGGPPLTAAGPGDGGAGALPTADAAAGGGGPQAPTGPAAAVGPFAVAYRVLLPRLAAAYARHAAVTSPAADGPVVRTLGLVRPDVTADWAEGEALVQELLVDGGAVDTAAAAVAAAERAFLA